MLGYRFNRNGFLVCIRQSTYLHRKEIDYNLAIYEVEGSSSDLRVKCITKKSVWKLTLKYLRHFGNTTSITHCHFSLRRKVLTTLYLWTCNIISVTSTLPHVPYSNEKEAIKVKKIQYIHKFGRYTVFGIT